MPKLYLNQLEADPRNPNTCSPQVMAKLKANIKRTKLCAALIVRPHPTKTDHYIIIDGHHRKQVLESLGWKKVSCQVWGISEQEAQLALATLNRLRGTDIPYKRAELLESLTEFFPAEALAELVPETEDQIQDLLRLLQTDLDDLEKALKAEIAKEEAELPIPYTFLIKSKDKEIVENALKTFSANLSDRGEALVQICAKAMEKYNVDF